MRVILTETKVGGNGKPGLSMRSQFPSWDFQLPYKYPLSVGLQSHMNSRSSFMFEFRGTHQTNRNICNTRKLFRFPNSSVTASFIYQDIMVLLDYSPWWLIKALGYYLIKRGKFCNWWRILIPNALALPRFDGSSK